MKTLDSIGKTQRTDAQGGEVLEWEAAKERRTDEFWRPMLKMFYFGYDRQPANPSLDAERRENVKSHILKAIKEDSDSLANGVCRLPLEFDSKRQLMEVVMFVIAFDATFEYRLKDPDDENDPNDTDTLFDESVFQRDLRTALDAYVLEGAKLAKRTDSCSYEMWTEALIMLGNIANARYEAAEIDDATREMMLLVIEAQEQLWADMRVNA